MEAKSNDINPTGPLIKFSHALETNLNFQLVSRTDYRKQFPNWGITVVAAESFFAGLV